MEAPPLSLSLSPSVSLFLSLSLSLPLSLSLSLVAAVLQRSIRAALSRRENMFQGSLTFLFSHSPLCFLYLGKHAELGLGRLGRGGGGGSLGGGGVGRDVVSEMSKHLFSPFGLLVERNVST